MLGRFAERHYLSNNSFCFEVSGSIVKIYLLSSSIKIYRADKTEMFELDKDPFSFPMLSMIFFVSFSTFLSFLEASEKF